MIFFLMSRKHPWDFERAYIESVSGWYWQLGSKSSNPRSWALCPFIYVFSNFSHRRFVVFIVKSLSSHWSQHWHPEACIVAMNLVSEWGCVAGPPQEAHRSCSQRCPTLACSQEGVRQASLLWLLYFCLHGDPFAGVPSCWHSSFGAPEAPACQKLTVLMVGKWWGSSPSFPLCHHLAFCYVIELSVLPLWMYVFMCHPPRCLASLINRSYSKARQEIQARLYWCACSRRRGANTRNRIPCSLPKWGQACSLYGVREGVSRVQEPGGRLWLKWFAHPLMGVECRGHVQYPAFASNPVFAFQKW